MQKSTMKENSQVSPFNGTILMELLFTSNTFQHKNRKNLPLAILSH